MAEVYKIITPDGQEFAYHRGAEDLKKDHPGARITHRLVMDTLGQGMFEEYSTGRARAEERKGNKDADKDASKANKNADKAARHEGDAVEMDDEVESVTEVPNIDITPVAVSDATMKKGA